MSHRSMGLFELLNGKSLLSGKTKGAEGRTKSIPEGYDGKFINPKKQTHSHVAVEKVEG